MMAYCTGQTTVVKNEKTTKPTSSVPQKVHNTFSKKKEHNGKKVYANPYQEVVEKKTSVPQ